MIKQFGLVAVAAMFAVSANAGEMEHAKAKQEMVTIHTVDMSGKPPFKRKLVTVPVEDVAAMEVEQSAKNKTKRLANDRPPYNRHQ